VAFDPSVIADIGASGPDITGSMAKGFQLKDMVDTQQLNQLKLNKEKATLADDEQFKTLSKGANLTTKEGVAEFAQKLTKSGQAGRAMEVMKYAQQQESGELDNQRQKVELHSAAQDIIAQSVDKIWMQATAMKNEKTPDGRPKYTDASINAWIQGQVPLTLNAVQSDSGLPEPVKKTALQGMQQFTAQNGQVTYDTLTQIERSTKQGQAQLKSMRDDLTAQTGAKKADIAERGEAERERHDRAMEAKGTGGGTPDAQAKRGDLLASIAAIGATLPAGLRNKETQNSTLDGLIRKYPDKTTDEIAQGIKDGTISMQVAKTESGVLGRREAAILPVEKSITKPGGFLDQAEQAVNAVDFSKLKAAGAFSAWSKEQNSDPALTAYKAAVAELRAEYSIVLSKGGQVTDAARHEAEKVIPDLITKDQFKSIKKTVRQGIEASKSGVEESIAGVTGKGGDTPKDDAPKVLKFDAKGNPVT